jgi:hypothetical protein
MIRKRLLLPLGVAACASHASDPPQPAPGVEYYADVKPIVDARCVGCHSPGGIAPFPLTSYDEVQPRAHLIAQAVENRIMPPWPAAPGCSEYVGDRSLSDAEIGTIRAWVDGNAPAGDPSRARQVPNAPDGRLPRVDRALTTPRYTVNPPTGEVDDFRCFVLDWPETAVKYVTGVRVSPSNAAIAHHLVSAYLPAAFASALEAADAADPLPGFACAAGTGMTPGQTTNLGGKLPPGTGALAAWAPGAPGLVLPDGVGMKVLPGSKILVQIHYNTLNGTGDDATTIELMLADTVTKEALSVPIASSDWVIPAGDPDFGYSFTFDPSSLMQDGHPLVVSHVGAHMHVRGKSAHMGLVRGGGAEECLLDIPKWNFHWQLSYELAKPTILAPGDKLRFECRWDNSAANQPTVNGVHVTPQDVTWGEGGTLSEMCIGPVLVYPQ